MAGSMNLIANHCLPNAERVIDRFHIKKLACEAVQFMRIENRWNSIKLEKEKGELAKKAKWNLREQYSAMGIQTDSYWQEADTDCTSLAINGQQNSKLK